MEVADLKEQLSKAVEGRYSIRRELGRSRISTVFLARDTKHQRRVAVKVLHPELTHAVEAEAFLHEIRTTAHLNHPHILTLLDSGQAGGLLYFVTPYVEGESLRDRLMWEKQLPPEDAVQICREVADALAYAHAHGMVHRDIKPENILLSDGHATVADFGLARAITAGCDEFAAEGDPGMAVGTPAYMSPEQASGSPDVDGRSDIYSLGCVLYEMLAGRPPFTGPTVELLLTQQIHAEPMPIIDYRPTLAPEITRALDRTLAKAPADRFSKASDLVAALPFPSDIRRAAAAIPGEMGKRTVPDLPHRRRARVGGVAALCAALLLSVAGVSWLWTPASPSATAGTEAKLSIAVLPFAVLSEDAEDSTFANGIHEDVLTQLSQIEALDVVSRTSVMSYRLTEKKVAEIGAELGVGSILEGSVRQIGDRVRITAQLIDANTDRHLWAETYDRRLTGSNTFSIQSEVAEAIAMALRSALLGSDDLTADATRQPVHASTR
jgi:serine/threonine protein kinase